VEAADHFSAQMQLPNGLRDQMESLGYFKAAVFGVLDVFMGKAVPPLRNVRVTIVDAEIHPVDSSTWGFRLAGRDAGYKILSASTASGYSYRT